MKRQIFDPNVVAGWRTCVECKSRRLDTKDHFPVINGRTQKSCKPCVADKRAKTYTEMDPAEKAKYQERRRFYHYEGMTAERYEGMFAEQNGRCKSCGDDLLDTKHGKTCIEHDHVTKEIRGIVCYSCNMWVGHTQEDLVRVCNMMKYLMDCVAKRTRFMDKLRLERNSEWVQLSIRLAKEREELDMKLAKIAAVIPASDLAKIV